MRPRVAAVDRTRAPAAAPAPRVRIPSAHRFTLSGGLPVIFVERREVPVVNLQLLALGGSGALKEGQAGLAALTADMLDEGTRSRSALQIAATLERMAATMYSAAGFDASELELNVLSARLPEALDLFSEVLREPTFPEAELERVRNERLGRIVQELEDPRAIATHAFARVIFGGRHAWGSPLLGTPRTLERLSRQDVATFYRNHVHPGCATLLAAGDVRPAELESLLEDALGGWLARPGPDARAPHPRSTQEPRICVVDRAGAPQSEIRVGKVAVARGTEDYFPLVVMNTVLGGAFTSRLNSNLREEKGYTYGAGSGFSMRRAPGPFVAHAAVHTPVTADAVREILAELRRMGEELVGRVELERAKRYVALRLPQRFETVADVTARLSESVLYGLPGDFYAGYVERVMAVTADDVREVARRHVDPRRMAVVVAGDRASIEEPLARLGIGPVEVLPALSWGSWSEDETPRSAV